MAEQGPKLSDEIKKLLEEYRQEIRKLKEQNAQTIECSFCKGTGKKQKADGAFARDQFNCFVPCEICRGKAKVRI